MFSSYRDELVSVVSCLAWGFHPPPPPKKTKPKKEERKLKLAVSS